MNEREYYERQACLLIKRYKRDSELSYKEIARRLESHGVLIDPQVLTNKVNRGTHSFSFALHLLAVLGVTSIDIPPYPPVVSKKQTPGVISVTRAKSRPPKSA